MASRKEGSRIVTFGYFFIFAIRATQTREPISTRNNSRRTQVPSKQVFSVGQEYRPIVA